MYLNENCRMCTPPEESYHTVRHGDLRPGRLGVSYQTVNLEGVTDEELFKYLREGALPHNICKGHMKDELSNRVEEAFSSLIKYSINLGNKTVTLIKKSEKTEIIKFNDLVDLLK